MGEPTPRRRRRSRREPDAEPPPDPTTDLAPPEPTAPADLDEESASERGLRGLVGGGSSQVNVRAALRARDATRPGPQHLADAETKLVIIRRGWSPPADPR